MDELFLSISNQHASNWACQLPMSADNSFLEVFPENAKLLKIHGNLAIVSLFLGSVRGAEILADLQGLTEQEEPLSDANLSDTNALLCLDDSMVFGTREQLFAYYPELAGQELVGKDGDGNNIYRDKIIFTRWAR